MYLIDFHSGEQWGSLLACILFHPPRNFSRWLAVSHYMKSVSVLLFSSKQGCAARWFNLPSISRWRDRKERRDGSGGGKCDCSEWGHDLQDVSLLLRQCWCLAPFTVRLHSLTNEAGSRTCWNKPQPRLIERWQKHWDPLPCATMTTSVVGITP